MARELYLSPRRNAQLMTFNHAGGSHQNGSCDCKEHQHLRPKVGRLMRRAERALARQGKRLRDAVSQSQPVSRPAQSQEVAHV